MRLPCFARRNLLRGGDEGEAVRDDVLHLRVEPVGGDFTNFVLYSTLPPLNNNFPCGLRRVEFIEIRAFTAENSHYA